MINTYSSNRINRLTPIHIIQHCTTLHEHTQQQQKSQTQNIIKMRAISDTSQFQRGYFIVLDRLYDTLTERMIAWKSQKGKMMGIAKVRDLRGAKKKELWIDRLMISYDICMALTYLHDNK